MSSLREPYPLPGTRLRSSVPRDTFAYPWSVSRNWSTFFYMRRYLICSDGC